MVGQPQYCQSNTHCQHDNHSLLTDVNECFEGQHNCDQQANTVCSNTLGSYTCDCQAGYGLSGRVCTGTVYVISNLLANQILFNPTPYIDINECVVDNVCDHSCTNTEGSFTCDCRSGFSKTLNEIGCLGKNNCTYVIVSIGNLL
jgi:hypothetical protein